MYENISKTSLVFQIHFVWALVSIPYARIHMEMEGVTRSELPHDFHNFNFNKSLNLAGITSYSLEVGYDTLKTENTFLYLKLFTLSLNENAAPFYVCNKS